MIRNHNERLATAREVLDGLSVGDALGEAFSYQHYRVREMTDFSLYGDGAVIYTDDTEMALGIYDILSLMKGLDEDTVAWSFTARFRRDPDRGYGKMARRILSELANGAEWREVSPKAFGGGSFGNGAAMRAGPLGGYYADDLPELVEAAAKSARVTHFHPEGIAGAIAVAAATAAAYNARGTAEPEAVQKVWQTVLDLTPEGEVHRKVRLAREMKVATADTVARELGCGYEISAQDTVPFCLWNACRNLGDYKEAILSTVEVGGDCDTNAAIVGSVVVAYSEATSIPREWLRIRETLKFKV